MKVLIVDDDPLNRKLLRTILATENHNVAEAEDGLAALKTLESEEIDAVISDIFMPRMDGYRLCYEIRKDKKLKGIPFIAHTATYTSPADEQVALNFGVDKFIRKPAPPGDILGALREITAGSSSRLNKQLEEPEELLAMREYSEALVRKLEESNLALTQTNKALEERALLAEFTAEITNALSQKGSLRERLQLCTQTMVRHLEAALARIWTFNPKEAVLELNASAGQYSSIDESHARILLGKYGIGLIGSEKKPLLTNSIEGDTRIHDQEWAKREGMSAFAGYPLLIENQLVGVMAIFSRQTLSGNIFKAMESAAKTIAVEIYNTQLHEQTERQLKHIEALREIDKAITSTLDLRAVLNLLLEKIEFFLPFSAASTIRLYNQAMRKFENTACRGINETAWKAGSERKTGQLSSGMRGNKAPIIIDNIQTDSQGRSPSFFRKQGFVSYLGVPLIAKDEILGILGFYTKKFHEFSSQEIDFLLTLAGQAAIAIHNAQLFEEIGHSNAELEKTTRYLGRSLKRLGGLYTALTPVAPSSSTEEMMDGILDRVIDATGADAALVRTWDRNASSYPIIGQRGFPEAYVKQIIAASGGGAVDWVIKHGEPVIAPDIAKEPRLKAKIQLQLGLRSCALLPLKIDGEVRGVMHVASQKLGYFDDAQREHLSAIARQMSIALENRELFYGLKLSRDKLERANRVKDEFLNVMSHELRTPVNLIMGYTNLLKEGAVGQEDGLKKISSASSDLLAMVDSILYATLLETNQLTVETQEFSLASLLEEVRADCDTAKPQQINLRWDYAGDLAAIRTDRKKLKNILHHLVHNALKFTERGETIVSARLLPSTANGKNNDAASPAEDLGSPDMSSAADWIEFKVADTGIGISADVLPKIFDKFYQADSSQSRQHGGTGLGLYIVKNFVDLLGGKIGVESEVGKGSRFTVTIPVSYQP
jgi:signal transduction histidine kinase/CheY-like chemotaxis protein